MGADDPAMDEGEAAEVDAAGTSATTFSGAASVVVKAKMDEAGAPEATTADAAMRAPEAASRGNAARWLDDVARAAGAATGGAAEAMGDAGTRLPDSIRKDA